MQENAPRDALDMWIVLEQTPFWWDKLFRFTAPQFFFDLLPRLHLPRNFRVDGCVTCAAQKPASQWHAYRRHLMRRV